MSWKFPIGNRHVNRIVLTLLISTVAIFFLSGCSQDDAKRGWLPSDSEGATNHTDRITHLWTSSWLVALIVGFVTWGLLIWAMIVYRRRKNATGYPKQLRYNMPIETFYIVLPLIMVMVFFAFTVRDQNIIDAREENPDIVVNVFGQQWSWTFNYSTAGVYYVGKHLQLDAGQGVLEEEMPTLYLPVNKSVELVLNSRDVIHSFWIPAFLQKKDMIPGKTNYINFVPEKEGTFVGKCAELCGEYHSAMLFQVKVVSMQEYENRMQELYDMGNIGDLGSEYDRNPGLLTSSAPPNFNFTLTTESQ